MRADEINWPLLDYIPSMDPSQLAADRYKFKQIYEQLRADRTGRWSGTQPNPSKHSDLTGRLAESATEIQNITVSKRSPRGPQELSLLNALDFTGIEQRALAIESLRIKP
jgi:hypothetical protein